MQRTASVTLKGIKIVKTNFETYTCGYSSKKADNWASLYMARPTGRGDTLFVPANVLANYIVRVVDSNRPDPDKVADHARNAYTDALETYSANGWVAGKRKVELCLNSLTCGKCVTAIEITPFDELYVQNSEALTILRTGENHEEKTYKDGERIEYDDFVSLMTE